MSSSVSTYVHTCVYITTYRLQFYMVTRKILEWSALIFVGTLRTLGQHEFAFGFCGSIRSLVAGDPCSLSTLVGRHLCKRKRDCNKINSLTRLQELIITFLQFLSLLISHEYFHHMISVFSNYTVQSWLLLFSWPTLLEHCRVHHWSPGLTIGCLLPCRWETDIQWLQLRLNCK